MNFLLSLLDVKYLFLVDFKDDFKEIGKISVNKIKFGSRLLNLIFALYYNFLTV